MVIITPEAQKQYKRLPVREQQKIRKKFFLLEGDPKAGKKLTGQFSELRSLRAWPYRIIYFIDERESEVFIVTIAHRQGVYK